MFALYRCPLERRGCVLCRLFDATSRLSLKMREYTYSSALFLYKLASFALSRCRAFLDEKRVRYSLKLKVKEKSAAPAVRSGLSDARGRNAHPCLSTNTPDSNASAAACSRCRALKTFLPAPSRFAGISARFPFIQPQSRRKQHLFRCTSKTMPPKFCTQATPLRSDSRRATRFAAARAPIR